MKEITQYTNIESWALAKQSKSLMLHYKHFLDTLHYEKILRIDIFQSSEAAASTYSPFL